MSSFLILSFSCVFFFSLPLGSLGHWMLIPERRQERNRKKKEKEMTIRSRVITVWPQESIRQTSLSINGKKEYVTARHKPLIKRNRLAITFASSVSSHASVVFFSFNLFVFPLHVSLPHISSFSVFLSHLLSSHMLTPEVIEVSLDSIDEEKEPRNQSNDHCFQAYFSLFLFLWVHLLYHLFQGIVFGKLENSILY